MDLIIPPSTTPLLISSKAKWGGQPNVVPPHFLNGGISKLNSNASIQCVLSFHRQIFPAVDPIHGFDAGKSAMLLLASQREELELPA
jgi:hypothetical protein